MADETTPVTDPTVDESKKVDEAEPTTAPESDAPAVTDEPTPEAAPEPEHTDEAPEAPADVEADKSETEAAPEVAPEVADEHTDETEAEGEAEPKVDPLTVSQTGSPTHDEAYPEGQPFAPDFESTEHKDETEGTEPPAALPSVPESASEPTDSSTLNPMASGETTSTPAPEDHTGPLEGDVKVAADTSAKDLGAVLSGSSVDAPKEESEVAEGDKADEPAAEPADEAQGHVGEDAPMPAIAEQPSKADAEAAKPLSAVATGPNQSAMDAMPEAAQQHMAQWLTPPDTNGQVAPDKGQLPNSRTLPGTQDDATGIAGEIDPVVRNNATSETGLDKSAPYHMPLVEGVKDDEGADEGDDEAELADDAGLGDDSAAEGFEGDDSDVDADEGIFGDTKSELSPLGDLAGDGIDAVKSAAEYAHTAQGQLQQIPVMMLELEHKDLLFRMREVLGEIIVLADKLFHRR